MNKIFLYLLLLCGSFTTLYGSPQRKAFIKKYKNIAIQEMIRTGIPASIKLAQGILESECGNSQLSIHGNNHFGIKCHNWSGGTIYHTDDEENECFRKYKTAEESWIDHSDFLCSRPRYSSLFLLSHTDYKGWARGLKEAGYATDPQYANKLIKIIEEEELTQYDLISVRDIGEEGVAQYDRILVKKSIVRNYRVIYINKVPCIETREGDSYEKIAHAFNIPLKKLLKYNDKRETSLRPGTAVFLKNKRNKAPKGYKFHRTKEGESIYEISQIYGIKLSRIIKYNLMDVTDKPQTGELIALRNSSKLY